MNFIKRLFIGFLNKLLWAIKSLNILIWGTLAVLIILTVLGII